MIVAERTFQISPLRISDVTQVWMICIKENWRQLHHITELAEVYCRRVGKFRGNYNFVVLVKLALESIRYFLKLGEHISLHLNFLRQNLRSEERRVGKECVSTGRSRGSTYQ